MPDHAVVMDMASDVAKQAGQTLRQYLGSLGCLSKRHLPDLWKHIVEVTRAKERADQQQHLDTQRVIENLIEEDSLLTEAGTYAGTDAEHMQHPVTVKNFDKGGAAVAPSVPENHELRLRQLLSGASGGLAENPELLQLLRGMLPKDPDAPKVPVQIPKGAEPQMIQIPKGAEPQVPETSLTPKVPETSKDPVMTPKVPETSAPKVDPTPNVVPPKVAPPQVVPPKVAPRGDDQIEDTGKDTGKDTDKDTGKDTGKDTDETLANYKTSKGCKSISTEFKGEYRTFMTQVANRHVFPAALAKDFKSNRRDIFELWRGSNHNWGEVVLSVQRKAAKTTKSEVERQMMKVRDLVRMGMPQDKAEKIRDARRAANQASWDPDFPNDVAEIRFWYDARISTTEGTETSESMAVDGTMTLDSEMAESVIGDGGILQAGLRAAAPGVGDEHQISFAESMSNVLTNDTCGKLKLTKNKPIIDKDAAAEAAAAEAASAALGPKSAEVVQTETKKLVLAKLDEMKKELKEATEMLLMLKAYAICKPTADGMAGHVKILTETFQTLTDLLKNNAPAVKYHG